MLQIHATKKLFAKLPVNDEGLLPESMSPPLVESTSDLLSDWTANLMIIERRQCVLFVHHQTRFPVFIPAVRKPDMKNLERLFENVFLNTLLKLGLSQEAFERAGDSIGRLQFDSNTNRSVLETMNQFKRDLEWICQGYNLDETTGYAITRELTQQFCGMKGKKGYVVPAEEMARLLGESEDMIQEIGAMRWERLASQDTPEDKHYFILKHYLDLYATDQGVTNLPELHGFLTGVLMCQHVVLPSEWISELWGGKQYSPEWPSVKDATEFQNALMVFYNEIAEELVIGIDDFEPLFAMHYDRPDREYSTPWCLGFMQGFVLDDALQDLPEDAHVAMAVISLPFDPKFAKDFDADGDIIDEHCEQVRIALKALFYYTRGIVQKPFSTSNIVPFTREAKVGRNEPCPCGSGKKYKKCCLDLH